MMRTTRWTCGGLANLGLGLVGRRAWAGPTGLALDKVCSLEFREGIALSQKHNEEQLPPAS